MQNSQNKKSLQIVLVVLIAVLTLGIGYASITAINLIISGNATASASQENFKVKFLEEENVTPTITSTDGGTGDIDVTSDTTATFNISGLDAEGESATANYVVKNVSEGIGAKITINLTSTNTEYFKVTTTVVDDTLQAGEETDVRVKVEMLKTPVDNPVTTTVIVTLTATPLEDAEATGGEQKEVTKPTPLIYTVNGVNGIYMNTDISNWTRTYSNFSAAKAEFGHPAAIAHETENGVVKVSYLVFERNGKVYYLKGRVHESDVADKPVFNKKISILKEAFGPDWESACNFEESNDHFYCSDEMITVGVQPYYGNTYVISNDRSWKCTVGDASSTGEAYCHNY